MDVPRFRTYVEDVPDHTCDLNTRLVVEMAVFGTEHPTDTERFCRALRLASVVSRRHPYTKGMFRSTSTFAAEVARHMEIAPNIIHPYSLLRSNYEIWMFAVYILFCVYTPLYIWKFSCMIPGVDAFYILILSFFWVDIAMNFATGYVNKKQFVVVLEPNLIARRYILSYFIIDIISSIPYSAFLSCMFDPFILLDPMKYYWIDVIVALKLIRTPTILSYYKQMAFRFGMSVVTRQLVRIGVALLLYLHWVACFCNVVTTISVEIFRSSAVNHFNETVMWTRQFKQRSLETTWRNSMLRAITLTFACGFRIIFTEFGDMLINIFFFLTGLIILGVVAVRIVGIAHSVQMRDAQFDTLETHLVEYMRHKQVSETLERRLIEYYRYCFERTSYHESTIVGFLSGQLQKDVLVQKGRLMMEATDVFADVPPAIMVRLVAGLNTTVVLAGDVVMRVGDPADRMMFVAAGTVAVYDVNGKELCHLRDGQMFGEQALVSKNEILGMTVVALEATELWELTRSFFLAATKSTSMSNREPGAKRDQTQTARSSIFDKLRKRQEQSRHAAASQAAALGREFAQSGGGGDRGGGDSGRDASPRGGAPAGGARAGEPRAAAARPAGARPAGDRPVRARPAGARPAGARPAGTRPAGARPAGARPAGAGPAGARPAAARPARAQPAAARAAGARDPRARPAARPGGGRPPGARQAGGAVRGRGRGPRA